MVANYRCNEIKEEAEKLVQGKMQSLLHDSSEKEITTFKDTVVGILNEAIQHYQSVARQYNPEVSNKIQSELVDMLQKQLYIAFDN